MNEGDTSHRDRAVHLEEKVKALAELIDPGYGKALIDQLLRRLEGTTKDFVMEVELLINRLTENAATQEELLERIRKTDLAQEDRDVQPDEEPEEEITEWEKRLARLEDSTE